MHVSRANPGPLALPLMPLAQKSPRYKKGSKKYRKRKCSPAVRKYISKARKSK